MRFVFVSSVLAAAMVTGACSSPAGPSRGITGLAGTGQNLNGTADASWEVTCSPTAASGVPCPVSLQKAQRVTNGYIEWLAPPGGSAWVGMSANGNVPAGVGDDQERYVYVYRLSFVVSGDPSTAVVSLMWACDNYFHGWRLNGGDFRDVQSANFNWRTLHPLTISSANASFQQGTNTLEFRVVGDGQTDGLLVTNVTGSVP